MLSRGICPCCVRNVIVPCLEHDASCMVCCRAWKQFIQCLAVGRCAWSELMVSSETSLQTACSCLSLRVMHCLVWQSSHASARELCETVAAEIEHPLPARSWSNLICIPHRAESSIGTKLCDLLQLPPGVRSVGCEVLCRHVLSCCQSDGLRHKRF